MLKKAFTLFCSALFLTLVIPVSSFARIIENHYAPKKNERLDMIVPEADVQKIEQLYDLRGVLSIDYEKNQTKIEQIDNELYSLGVSPVDYGYVLEKQEHCSSNKMAASTLPRASVPPYPGVGWDSYRFQTNVNGIVYELQVITGKPNSSDSDLLSYQLTYQNPTGHDYSALGNLLYTLTCAVASLNPITSTYATMLEIASAAYPYLTNVSNETVHNVKCSAVTTLTAHIKYVFVKYESSPDSQQIWMYLGNKAMSKTTFTVCFSKQLTPDGPWMADQLSYQKLYNVVANGYNDYNSMCWSYYMYKTNGTPFDSYHYIGQYTVRNKHKENNVSTTVWSANVSVPQI